MLIDDVEYSTNYGESSPGDPILADYFGARYTFYLQVRWVWCGEVWMRTKLVVLCVCVYMCVVCHVCSTQQAHSKQAVDALGGCRTSLQQQQMQVTSMPALP